MPKNSARRLRGLVVVDIVSCFARQHSQSMVSTWQLWTHQLQYAARDQQPARI